MKSLRVRQMIARMEPDARARLRHAMQTQGDAIDQTLRGYGWTGHDLYALHRALFPPPEKLRGIVTSAGQAWGWYTNVCAGEIPWR